MAIDKRENIEKWSLKYFLLYCAAKWAFKFYYRRLVASGTENIPYDSPIIFAPNHQGAVMDALAVLFSQKKNVVFLARADVFTRKTLGILTFLKIMPAYRMRDGTANVKRNEEIFNHTIRVLTNNVPLGIMPEGNHGDRHKLRQLAKGAFRIAFSTQEVMAEKSRDVKIIPVGINYDHYIKFGRPLYLNFGKPIEVKDYFEEYKTAPAIAINKLRDRLAQELSPLMIDIQNDEYYSTINTLRKNYSEQAVKILGLGKINTVNKFKAEKILIDKLTQEIEENKESFELLNGNVLEYTKLLRKYKLRNWLFEKKGHSFLEVVFRRFVLLLGLPLFLIGFIPNFAPFQLPNLFIKKIKDPQFLSSVKYLVAFISFILLYLIYLILGVIFIKPFWVSIIGIFTLPYLGLISFAIFKYYKKLLGIIRLRKLKRQKPEIYNRLNLLYKDITSHTLSLLKN